MIAWLFANDIVIIEENENKYRIRLINGIRRLKCGECKLVQKKSSQLCLPGKKSWEQQYYVSGWIHRRSRITYKFG